MNASLLLWGVLFSSVGMVYFVYGKKQDKRVALYCGVALMIIPYFIGSVYVLVGLCLALLALPYFFRV
jgi:cytochrome c biogenesis factor